jgi:hypothetical protein
MSLSRPVISKNEYRRDSFEIHRPKIFCCISGASALVEMIAPNDHASLIFGKTGNRETVQFREFAKFLRTESVGQIDSRKLNTVGAEYELLDHCLRIGVSEKDRFLRVWPHNTQPSSRAKMKSIRRRLSFTHECHYSFEFVWDGWSRRPLT